MEVEENKAKEEQKESAETVKETEIKEEAEQIAEKEEPKEEEIVEEAVEAKEEIPTPTEEEAKPPPRKEKPEEEIVEERIYTIPLGKAWIGPANRRAPRAVRIIKSFVTRHMKLKAHREGEEEEEPKKLVITNEVNESVWRKGIEKPPRKIRVRAAKDKEGNVTVYLAEGD